MAVYVSVIGAFYAYGVSNVKAIASLSRPELYFILLVAAGGMIGFHTAGVHAYNNASFQFRGLASLDSDLIDHGPVKIFIVRSGWVRLCLAVCTVRWHSRFHHI